MRKIFVIAVMLFSIVSFVSAFETQLDRAKIIKIGKGVTKKKYPDAHSVLVDDLIVAQYDMKGVATTTDDTYLKVLDEVGKKENSSTRLWYDTNYGFAEMKVLELIKPDGKIVPIDIKKNMKIQSDSSSAAMNIYDTTTKIVKIQIPGIEVGDILHYYSVRYTKKPRLVGHFSDFQIGEYTEPIVHSKYVVIAPEKNPLKHFVVLDPVKGHYKKNEIKKDGKIYYTFEVNNVPQVISEPAMPSLSRVVMRVLVSTIPNWEYISKWYANLSEPKFKISDEMKKKVEELIKGKKTEMEKIRAIFYFVSRKIRYMGVTTETNRPGLEPHAADYTFKTRTGVCRDKAALIVAMLRYAGVDAHMVLINASRKLDKEVPMTYFNHAIAGARLKNGKHILMDPTDETTKDLLPQYEMDKTYVLCTKEGDTLRTTPVLDPDVNKFKVDTVIHYKDGKYYGETTMFFYGLNDNALRGYLVRLNKKKKRDLIERIMKEVSSTTKIITYDVEPKNLLGSRDTLKFIVKYEISDMVIGSNGYKMLTLPQFGNSFGAFSWGLRGMTLPKRKYPFIFKFTASVDETIRFKNDTGKKMAVEYIPEDFNKDNGGFIYKATYKPVKSGFVFHKYAAIAKLEYSPAEYLNLKNTLKAIENYNKKYIIIREK